MIPENRGSSHADQPSVSISNTTREQEHVDANGFMHSAKCMHATSLSLPHPLQSLAVDGSDAALESENWWTQGSYYTREMDEDMMENYCQQWGCFEQE
jgi:hypothetical protein